jgi:hypothetical protein
MKKCAAGGAAMRSDGYRINPAIGDEDMEQVKAFQKGVRLLVKLNQLKGAPVARFDFKTKKPYLEYPDGRKEYADD